MNVTACTGLGRRPLTGTWYRVIQPQHWKTLLATAHTRQIPSRFAGGSINNPQFEILYGSENPVVAQFEAQMLFGSLAAPIPKPRQNWICVNIDVILSDVADLSDLLAHQALATTAEELTGDWRGYQQRSPMTSVTQPTGLAPTQELGAALFYLAGLEGFTTVSAKIATYRNLAVFPQKLRPGSKVEFSEPGTGDKFAIGPN